MDDPHRLKPGTQIQLAEIGTAGKRLHDDRESAEEEFFELRERLVQLQWRLYAEGRRKLLVVLQAMDAGGKDGTIRHVFRGVNPQGVRVTSFKQPTADELARDFLWRIHRAVPPAGMIGVFNRSHYEDVLVARVDGLVPESVWRRRYQQINDFEALLRDNGTTILKFYLHISRKEQKKRFQARLEDPAKNWKFSLGDLEKRARWDAYLQAYQDALHECNTEAAAWHVIPADQKWYRNLAIARTLVATLDEMNPQFPMATIDVGSITIE